MLSASVANSVASWHPVLNALLASLFTWGVTAAGAALVFWVRKANRRIMDALLGAAAGVMIAASYWSLLAPAIELSGNRWGPAALGFLAGGGFLWIVDKILPHLHPGLGLDQAEGLRTSWQRSVLLVLAITLHNIPEGLAVGVAFGAAAHGLPGASFGAAIALAIGIGLQNFPEGAAVSMPLLREGWNKRRSFLWGQLSGAVEPVAGVIGALVVSTVRPLLPYALAFAAGAMIYVVVEELIPESQQGQNTDLATLGTMTGFVIMMILDVALG